jgi:hypothetical protein
MGASQELLKEEMMAKLEAHYERMMARMDSQLEKWRPRWVPIRRK